MNNPRETWPGQEAPERATNAREVVLAGLRAPQKRLPPWLFYDARGSALFARITQQPEYYPTRCEREILRAHAPRIGERIGAGAVLVELGPGSAEKVKLLLEGIPPIAVYLPIDISRTALEALAVEVARAYPRVVVQPVHADFSRSFRWPPLPEGARRAVFYPGSTIGNLSPDEAGAMLQSLGAHLAPGDGLLVGVDLCKGREILEPAYDDAAGVTAAFDLNALLHVDRLVGGDLDPERFEHVAFWNEALGRVEMHLRSRVAHEAQVAGETIRFEEGETIHTENSWKYTIEGFRALAIRAGLVPVDVWTDRRGWFSVHWLEVP